MPSYAFVADDAEDNLEASCTSVVESHCPLALGFIEWDRYAKQTPSSNGIAMMNCRPRTLILHVLIGSERIAMSQRSHDGSSGSEEGHMLERSPFLSSYVHFRVDLPLFLAIL